jgi:hypothetical protein
MFRFGPDVDHLFECTGVGRVFCIFGELLVERVVTGNADSCFNVLYISA